MILNTTVHHTKMADHFLETPEYEQSKNLGLVYLKGVESVKRMISKYKFCWLDGQVPTRHFHEPPTQFLDPPLVLIDILPICSK